MRLINFVDLTKDEKKLILNWRNDSSIRKRMHDSNIIKEKTHFEFIENLKKDKKNKYFLVRKEENIGVVSFTDISYESSKTQIGLYAKPQLKGVGSLLMKKILEYSLEKLKINILIAEVFENNLPAIKLYEKFGFKKIARDNNIIVMERINENR